MRAEATSSPGTEADHLLQRPGTEEESFATRRPSGIFLLDSENLDLIYSSSTRAEIGRLTNIIALPQTRQSVLSDSELLAETEVIFSGWGAPRFDAEFLTRAPQLKAVFYGAGSVRPLVSEAFWKRNILITSAAAANAVPVAEYALGVILLSLKHFWQMAAHARGGGAWGDHTRAFPGCYGTTVGLVSFGLIARQLLELLRPFDVNVLVYCPMLTNEEAENFGVERCSLAEVFRRADVVSLHTPVLPETEGLITGELMASMKPGATLLNTARGVIIREPEMVKVLTERPDLTAVLDVTNPEPPSPENPLFRLPNAIVTPHIAGSHAVECRRMGDCMLEELRRFLAGEPLKFRVTREMISAMA